MTVLRSIAYARGVVIAASPLGKFKMVSQVVAILLLILGHDHLQQFFVLGQIALWVAVITAVASGIDYYRRFNHVLAAARSRFRAASRPSPSWPWFRSFGLHHLDPLLRLGEVLALSRTP